MGAGPASLSLAHLLLAPGLPTSSSLEDLCVCLWSLSLCSDSCLARNLYLYFPWPLASYPVGSSCIHSPLRPLACPALGT